jgi:heterotetrameric sarcosine oxidase gamma subunit
MAEVKSFIADPVIADHAASPLAGHFEQGEFGALPDDGECVALSERFGLSIAEVSAWRGEEEAIAGAISSVTGLKLKIAPGNGAVRKNVAAFNIAPGRWLVSGSSASLVADLDRETGKSGTVTDLSHGRTVIRIDGARSRWVLAKIFSVDLSEKALAHGNGLATAHHEIFASIQRAGPDAFDIYVFRSFARSFWHLLRRSAEEVGYRVE